MILVNKLCNSVLMHLLYFCHCIVITYNDTLYLVLNYSMFSLIVNVLSGSNLFKNLNIHFFICHD